MPTKKDSETAIQFDDETEVSTPAPVSMIELAAIRHERQRLAVMRAELGALTMALHQREQDVIRRIEDGALVDGDAVVLVRRRQNISWLTVVAKELGPETVERIKDAWPMSFWKELQIA